MTRFLIKYRGYMLIAPLVLFVLLFFVWPLASILKQSFYDATMASNLPLTRQALAGWDRVSLPSKEVQIALIDDLHAIKDDRDRGEVVRRLNSSQAGFRTLMTKTFKAVDAMDAENPTYPDLTKLDRKWKNVAYWNGIYKILPPFTDEFLLLSLDMKRENNGQIKVLDSVESANRAVMLRTFGIALVLTIVCVLIGFPYALIMVSVSPTYRFILLAAIFLPLWTSIVVRMASWYVMLQDSGILNGLFKTLGIIDTPIPLLFNRAGVIITMANVLLPLMVLPIYSVLLSIPKTLMPAALSLGAHPILAFIKIILPLSMRGIASGSLLVFITSTGFYIAPALVGGPTDQMITSTIAFYAMNSANWGMASALSAILLFITLILYFFYSKVEVERA